MAGIAMAPSFLRVRHVTPLDEAVFRQQLSKLQGKNMRGAVSDHSL
jgi:hypothetical protein